MANNVLIKMAYAASAVALLGLTGCGGGGKPDDGYAVSSPSGYEPAQPSGELMGGTPAPAIHDDGLAGGPASHVAEGPGAMASVPNPENLPLEERRRVYGNKYDHLKYRPLAGSSAYAPAEPAQQGGYAPTPRGDYVAPPAEHHVSQSGLRTYRKPDGTLVVSNHPIANPDKMSARERHKIYGSRYARSASTTRKSHRAWSQPAPHAAAPVYKPAPARPAPMPPKARAVMAPPKVAPPVAVAKAPAPVQPKLVAPVKAPVIAPTAKVSAGDARMAALSTAVSAEAIKGAVLTVPDTLAKGQESKVSLSLPVNLLDVIRTEAGKLGLTKAAKKAEVSATLTGDGYSITPNAAQTQLLKTGEAATFNWNVKPGDGEKTPLKATVDGALKGQKGDAKTFSVATIEQVVAATVDNTASTAKTWKLPSLDKLAFPGLKPITVAGTVIPPGATTAGIIALILLLILAAMGRVGADRRARAERRRKFRTMSDYGNDVEETVTPVARDHAHSPVNPMFAAAGGAAAGYGASAMTFGDHSHDHGHDHVVEQHVEPAHVVPAHVAADGHVEPAHVEPAHVVPTHVEPAHGAAPADPHHHREPEHV